MTVQNPSRRHLSRAGGIALLAAAGLALAACGSGNDASSNTSAPKPTPPPATTMAPQPKPTPPQPTTAPPTTTAPQPKPTVSLADNPAIGQKVLVDAKGMTLYLFVPDGTSPKTTVPDEFKPNWPPVVATGTPTGGTGLDMTELGVQPQTNGIQQVTYNGHLLYTFINDKTPGDTNGQALGPNNWFVLDANGKAIGAPRTKGSGSAMKPAHPGGW
jgi:predicted lipoprotein with Yx(FWY)xxD motif